MHLISRADAIARIEVERAGAPCLICALVRSAAGPTYALSRTERATVILTRYALRRGHLLVLAREHATSFTELAPETWEDMNRLAFHAARVLERTLAPLRCYVASLGAPRPDLLMSSPHAHLHVVPLHAAEDKPSTVLRWDTGVLVAEEAEWAELHRELAAAW
jgi:diadenosine tetraphosphate (Ap4A) HIT family hydrolase